MKPNTPNTGIAAFIVAAIVAIGIGIGFVFTPVIGILVALRGCQRVFDPHSEVDLRKPRR